MNNLVSKKKWEDKYKYNRFFVPMKDDSVRIWIEKFLVSIKYEHKKNVFEIGCYPARYLSVFGEHNYILNGVDIVDGVTDLKKWLSNKRYCVGNISRDDFEKAKINEKFDIVVSFGFIEHFINWKEILTKEADLVKPGGYLVVSTPNFRGFIQRSLHYILDRDNYFDHNIEAMNMGEWEKVLLSRGFTLVSKNSFGGFGLWFDSATSSSKIRFGRRLLIFLFGLLNRYLKVNSYIFSPYIGMIVRKI